MTFVTEITPFICCNLNMNQHHYLCRMLLGGTMFTAYLCICLLSVNHLLIAFTMPLAVLAQLIFTKQQHCSHCQKKIFERSATASRHYWGVLYFPLECPHCNSNLCIAPQEYNQTTSSTHPYK